MGKNWSVDCNKKFVMAYMPKRTSSALQMAFSSLSLSRHFYRNPFKTSVILVAYTSNAGMVSGGLAQYLRFYRNLNVEVTS